MIHRQVSLSTACLDCRPREPVEWGGLKSISRRDEEKDTKKVGTACMSFSLHYSLRAIHLN